MTIYDYTGEWREWFRDGDHYPAAVVRYNRNGKVTWRLYVDCPIAYESNTLKGCFRKMAIEVLKQ